MLEVKKMADEIKDGDVPLRGNPVGKEIRPEKPSDVGSNYQQSKGKYSRGPEDEKGPGCRPEYTGWIG